MRIASRRGSVDSLRMLPATFNAGAYRVAPADGSAVAIAACSRPRSDVDRTATSAPVGRTSATERARPVSFHAGSGGSPPEWQVQRGRGETKGPETTWFTAPASGVPATSDT